jgi:hypothetical protein
VNEGGTFDIINGLPPGTQINSNGMISNFFDITRTPDPLGGELDDYSAFLQLQMTGTGALGGYHRFVQIPLSGVGANQMAHKPRVPGDLIQSFDSDMFRLSGQLPIGDPDFDLLRITAGTDFGMPSPGHTTLTKLPNGNWNVDSFFDITYRIDFIGAPGGPLAGMSGSTTATIRIHQGGPTTGGGTWIDLFEPPAFTTSLDLAFVITNGTTTAASCTPRDTVFAGSDLFTTPAGGATVDSHFTAMPIPSDFFDPGSDPFTGDLTLQGSPLQTTPPNVLGPTDVVVRRNLDAILPPPPSSAVVPIEIVALSLVSSSPITVTYQGGMNPERWDVHVCLSVQQQQCVGSMTINRDCHEGGTFSATLPVLPLFTFVRQSDMAIRVLDFGMLPLDPCNTIVFKTLNGHWTYCDPGLNVITAPAGMMVDHACIPPRPVTILPSSNFFPGVRALPCCPDSTTQGYTKQLTEEEAQLAQHGVLPPQQNPPDMDGDYIPDDADNCPSMPNPLQEDQDDDHIGDICDPDPTNPPPSLACENAGPCDCKPGDANGDNTIDISDVVYLISYIFSGGSAPIPYAVCSGDANCDCAVDISDAVYLISYIFSGGSGPCTCQEWQTKCGVPLRK